MVYMSSEDFEYKFFFLCKQKTAYEMRISDWSSDVCSSDLRDILAHLVSGAVAGDGEHQWPVVAAGTKRQVERTQVDRLVAPGLGEGGARRGDRKSVV